MRKQVPPALGPETLYKFLGPKGVSSYARFKWPRPRGHPGRWVQAKGPLRACQNGIHLCREQDLLFWLQENLFVAEARGERLDSDNKVVVREARLLRRVATWNHKTMVLFACDCAERALRLVTRKYGKQDRRAWKALRVARAFMRGHATVDEARNAARAAYAVHAASAHAASASASAYAYAYAAAAAKATAEQKERTWQAKRLMEYLRGERS